MAFWCKSDGGQHQGRLPPTKATQHRSYGRFITVLRRDWVVVAGAEIRLFCLRPSVAEHGNGSAIIAHQPAHSPQRREHCVLRGSNVHHAFHQCPHRCILVSSEVSHRIATMVSRNVRAYPTLACTFRLPGWGSSINGTHPDRCGTCAICRTTTELHQHQLPKR